jgi:hypothetical protein
MALYVKQTDTRSQLQEKLAKELQDRAKEKAKAADMPDGIEYSKYIEGTRTTSSLAWAWILVMVAIVAIAIWLIVISTT